MDIQNVFSVVLYLLVYNLLFHRFPLLRKRVNISHPIINIKIPPPILPKVVLNKKLVKKSLGLVKG